MAAGRRPRRGFWPRWWNLRRMPRSYTAWAAGREDTVVCGDCRPVYGRATVDLPGVPSILDADKIRKNRGPVLCSAALLSRGGRRTVATGILPAEAGRHWTAQPDPNRCPHSQFHEHAENALSWKRRVDKSSKQSRRCMHQKDPWMEEWGRRIV